MPTLGYWAIRGLAQPIRLLLHYCGEEFEDVKYEQGDPPSYSREAWNKVKPTLNLPFANLPYFIDGDIKLTQPNAILRYIGRKHELMGSTETERTRVDMMESQAVDFRNNVVRLCYNPEYEKLKVNYFKNIPNLLKLFEEFLGEDSWFAGKNITIVDFTMYELLDQHRIMEATSLEDFPKLTAFLERFEALPNIKKYMDSDQFLARPINNKVAHFKSTRWNLPQRYAKISSPDLKGRHAGFEIYQESGATCSCKRHRCGSIRNGLEVQQI